MPTQDEIFARYRRVEREADAFGRVIGVRKLRVSEQTKVSEMTPALDGQTVIKTEDGGEITIDRRLFMIVAASVCEIDAVPIPFPRTRGELDSIADRLDDEGIASATKAWVKLHPKRDDSEEAVGGNDAAKKSLPTM